MSDLPQYNQITTGPAQRQDNGGVDSLQRINI